MITQIVSRTLNSTAVVAAVAQILADNEAEQRRLIREAGGDDQSAQIRIYLGRTDPISEWTDLEIEDPSPIVVVTPNKVTFSGANHAQSRASVAISIECYAVGVATQAHGSGVVRPEQASLESIQSVAAFVYRVLMANEYGYLLPATRQIVGRRFIESMDYIAAEPNETRSVTHVRGCLISLTVDTVEQNQTVDSVPLAIIRSTITDPRGRVLANITSVPSNS